MKITPLEHWISRRIGKWGDPFSRETLEAYQLEKLNETIEWARKNSSFYRARLAGFEKAGISRLGDLARFPFTTADDIRHDPLQFLCVSQSEIRRVVTLPTSGTTGDPKRVHFTVDDQELTIDFFCHGMSTLVGPGDRVLILLPGERPGSVGDLLVKGLDRLGAVGIPHGLVQDVGSTLEVLEREKVDALVGIPVQILALARLGRGRGAVRSVLLSTDHVPEAITRALQRLWGCEVFNHYGMTEMGYGGGVECRAHFGYHMREADLLFEIIDPETGSPVEEGEPGEVVFTTLTRRGMPLIRYQTGDVSRFIYDKCPCGTLLRSMECVKGRIGGNIRLTPNGVLRMADLDEALFPLSGLLDFGVTLTREKDRERLALEIYTGESAGEGMIERAQSALNTIPAVRAACENEALSVSVSVRREGWTFPMGSTKRRFLDQRDSFDTC
jgi:phenylacetate-CoA ligase